MYCQLQTPPSIKAGPTGGNKNGWDRVDTFYMSCVAKVKSYSPFLLIWKYTAARYGNLITFWQVLWKWLNNVCFIRLIACYNYLENVFILISLLSSALSFQSVYQWVVCSRLQDTGRVGEGNNYWDTRHSKDICLSSFPSSVHLWAPGTHLQGSQHHLWERHRVWFAAGNEGEASLG